LAGLLEVASFKFMFKKSADILKNVRDDVAVG
jgi:hypothetical protein